MRRLTSTLLSKRIVLFQIILILAGVLAAYLVPQSFSTRPEDIELWQNAHPLLWPWLERLGFGHVYSTWWFAAILAFFLLTLTLSSIEQVQRAMRVTFGPGGSGGIPVSIDNLLVTEFTKKVKRSGYLRTFQEGKRTRFVKHPLGYWGNVLLHVGMVVILASSLLLVVTETRGLLHLIEDEIHQPGNSWLVEETGVFGRKFKLPAGVRLDQVDVEYWETDDVKQLGADLSFIHSNGRVEKKYVGINQTTEYKGIKVYQGRRYGDAFFVKFIDNDGQEFPSILQMEHPLSRSAPSYGNFFVDGLLYQVKAKYFADFHKNTMQSDDPLLVMRLMELEEVVGEASLRLSEKSKLGPYEVEFAHVAPWSGIIFVQSSGMGGIFAGFLILVAGVSLTYFFPPREIVATEEECGVSFVWRASRFTEFYEDEYQEIVSALGGGRT